MGDIEELYKEFQKVKSLMGVLTLTTGKVIVNSIHRCSLPPFLKGFFVHK